MTSSYTDNIGIEKPETGDQVGTWGITDNLNYDIVDQSISGYVSVTLGSAGSSGSPNDFDITDGALSNGRNPFISFTDAGDLGADVFVRLTPNDHKKLGWIENNLSGSQDLFVFQGTYSASNDYVIPAGQRALLRFDGGGTGAVVTNVLDNVRIEDLIHVGNLTIGGTLGVTGATTLSSTLGVTGATTLTGGLAGNPTVNTGNFVIGTAGKGVDFSVNAGTAASGAATTSELLDFYEEGTWTPALVDSSENRTEATHTVQNARFTRVGRCVFVQGILTISAKNTLSGIITIDGLPYNAFSSATEVFAGAVKASGLNISAGESLIGNMQAGGNDIILSIWNLATGTSLLQASDITDSFSCTFGGFFHVS